uniref:RNA pseudouridine synthase A 2, putative n=1 Tax=Babesia bovis TaxID=5865 RepID=S6B361_BABBO|nr:RNA pseudouridine synthase A 2, putative [Babesia bovis]
MKDSQFRNTLIKKYNDVRQHFSLESMQKGADVIQGTHNFEGFRKKSRGNEKALIKDPICTIEKIDIKRDRDDPENKFHIAVYGNRFLYKMVRGIVSHLVMVRLSLFFANRFRLLMGFLLQGTLNAYLRRVRLFQRFSMHLVMVYIFLK